jgi:hypothetical protein
MTATNYEARVALDAAAMAYSALAEPPLEGMPAWMYARLALAYAEAYRRRTGVPLYRFPIRFLRNIASYQDYDYRELRPLPLP